MYINAYARPASYISIDVNPSMEICLNKWNRVIDVIPYNDDAERICRQLNLKNKYYTDAIEELLCNKDFQAYYLNQNTSDLTFTIVSQYCDELQSGIESCKSYSEASGIIHHANMDTSASDISSGTVSEVDSVSNVSLVSAFSIASVVYTVSVTSVVSIVSVVGSNVPSAFRHAVINVAIIATSSNQDKNFLFFMTFFPLLFESELPFV